MKLELERIEAAVIQKAIENYTAPVKNAIDVGEPNNGLVCMAALLRTSQTIETKITKALEG